ncbi:MAG: hypothetical protein AAF401_13770 [Pseudomonadota bacterium]
MIKIAVFSLFALIFSVFGAFAAEPSGKVQAAIEAWLADDDEASLTALAGLANAGDVDAQMLISQIERETPSGGETPFVLAMDRKARKDVFRAPGGLSGTPWVKVKAGEGDAVAAALLDAKLPDAGMETAHILFQAGEREAAKRLAWEIVERGRFDAVLSMEANKPLLGALPYLAWLQGWFGGGVMQQQTWVPKSPVDGRGSGLMFVALVAPMLAPQFAPQPEIERVVRALRGQASDLVNAGEADSAATLLEDTAKADPNLSFAGRMCERLCPGEVGRCMISTMALLGGYDRLMFQDSPLERLIPQKTYLASKRAENVLERRVRSAVQGFSTVSASGYEVSQCLKSEVSG